MGKAVVYKAPQQPKQNTSIENIAPKREETEVLNQQISKALLTKSYYAFRGNNTQAALAGAGNYGTTLITIDRKTKAEVLVIDLMLFNGSLTALFANISILNVSGGTPIFETELSITDLQHCSQIVVPLNLILEAGYIVYIQAGYYGCVNAGVFCSANLNGLDISTEI